MFYESAELFKFCNYASNGLEFCRKFIPKAPSRQNTMHYSCQ